MDKVAYETAVYTAFFDELEKLGYVVDEMEKEAILGAIKQFGAKAIGAMTPSSVKASRALANPAMTSVGKSPQALTAMSKARQLAPAAPMTANPAAQAVRARTAERISQTRAGLNRTVGTGLL